MWKLKVGDAGKWLMSVNNHVGRQHWEFDPDAGSPEERAEVERARTEFKSNRFVNKQSSDVLMRMQLRKENRAAVEKPIPAAVKVDGIYELTEEAVATTLKRGVSYLCSIQAHDGHWPSDNAGPSYFLPPLVMSLYVTGGLNSVLSYEHQREIKRYIYNHQNEDGGWGLHIEGESSTFASVLNYVALRLLGEGQDDGEDNAMTRARKWILDHGGAVGVTLWGKFWLAVVGVYEWDGCNPIPPEFWLLPPSSPVNPGNLMSFCRLVYMPMSYLYGKRFVGKITQLVEEVRKELYVQPYMEVDWNHARNNCAKEDLYYQRPLVQDLLWEFLYYVGEPIMRRWPFSKLRENAMNATMEQIHYEDINSRYITIGCVEKFMCLVACWAEDPNSEAYLLHLSRIPDYLWVAEDGMKVQAVAGSQVWDALLAIQALLASNLTQEYAETLHKLHDFLKCSQIRENPSGNFKHMFRHQSKGSWPFSVPDIGWQVSDCTGEGVKAMLLLSKMSQELGVEKAEDPQRLYDAVDVILMIQSGNGGFPAWEPKRAYQWLEKFNPTEFSKDCFIEDEHVECTSSSIQGLALFKKFHPTYRRQEIESSITKALQYILNKQNADGSWTGSWGICFTYGTWFAVEALKACGKNYNNCSALRRACTFLLSKQLTDGGWGESHLSCRYEEYLNIEGDKSNLVQTSWALLALISAGQLEIDPIPIKRGVMLLVNSQVEQDGDFPQQEMTGVFYRTNPLHYGIYRNVFPIWALGEYQQRYAQIAGTSTL